MTKKMNDVYVKEIAEVILSQLATDQMEVFAWGSKNFTCYAKQVDGFNMPTLRFDVRTPKLSKGGVVEISLNEGEDLYIIEAFRKIDGVLESIEKQRGIYCDEMHMRIRDMIEDEDTIGQMFF